MASLNTESAVVADRCAPEHRCRQRSERGGWRRTEGVRAAMEHRRLSLRRQRGELPSSRMEASSASVSRRQARRQRMRRCRRSSHQEALRGSLTTLTDSENVTVRMADVHLAHVPRHVSRWPGYLEAMIETALVSRFDIVDSDHHPGPLVADLVASWPEGDF